MKVSKSVVFVLAFVSLFSLGVALAAAEHPSREVSRGDDTPSGKVDPRIVQEMARSPDGQARFIVYLREKADLSTAYSLTDHGQRGQWVYTRLRQAAQESQAEIIAYLDAQRAASHVTDYRSFWVFNGLAVVGDRETLEALAARDDVERIAADRYLKRIETTPTPSPTPPVYETVIETVVTVIVTVPTPTPAPQPTQPPPPPPNGLEWNIALINADDVWTELGVDGSGVVVANMDTGVLYTHPALAGKYRGANGGSYDHNYNWYDATGQYPYVPADGYGHGTHTMGTIVGDDGAGNRIGVAPGAEWIAVKVLNDWGCGYDSDIHAGFQWLLAPTDLNGDNPDPSRAPHVVNNSWGNDDGWDTEFQQDVQALLAAGIVPVFSAGNNGPASGTIGSPASYPASWAVGATNGDDVVADFSSRGPSPLTTMTKPEFCAPGVAVRSSWNDGDYVYLSGTSMAAPHVTGLIALLLQANPNLTLTELQTAITSTGVDLGDRGPDYTYGWGRIDAYEAVFSVYSVGTLTGRVTAGDSGLPLADVAILARSQTAGITREAATDAQGVYTLTLPAGAYDLTARTYGYLPVTTTVTIITDTTTTQDLTLPLAPRYLLSGQVTEAGTGAPLAATITILDTPLAPVETDPATGVYTITVAQGDYEIKATSRSHATAIRNVSITGDTVENFLLAPIPPILLVDDDKGHTHETYFTQALGALAEDYTLWDVSWQGEPPFSELEQYPIVIWNTAADHTDTLSPYAEAELMDYLDGGGQLFLSSRGYMIERGTSDFARDYLHVSSDVKPLVSIETVAGAPGDPVGAWLGPYTLSYPPSFGDVSTSIHPDIAASAAFIGQFGQPVYSEYVVGATHLDRYACFRTVHLGVPFEALPAPDGVVVLRRILGWFRSGCDFGVLTGRVDDVLTGEPLTGAIVSAQGGRDRFSVMTGETGVYTMPLLAGTYTLVVAQDGYVTETATGVTVTVGATTTLDLSLRPQIALFPPSLDVNLMVGRSLTRSLVISNVGPTTLEYAIFEGEGDFTPTLPGAASAGYPAFVGRGLRPTSTVRLRSETLPSAFVGRGLRPTSTVRLRSETLPNSLAAASAGYPALHVPFSDLIPTLDGVYTAGEWDDGSVVSTTVYYDPQGEEVGRVYVKHSLENLYVLMEQFGASGYNVYLSTGIWVNLGDYRSTSAPTGGGNRGFHSIINAGSLETHFDYPGRVQVGQSSTPGHPAPHWIYEYEIPLAGLHVWPGRPFGIYFTTFDHLDDKYGEWYNSSPGYDSYSYNWPNALLEASDTPWLVEHPVTGTVAADDSRTISVTCDATSVQPGIHTAKLMLVSRDGATTIVNPLTVITMTVEPSPTMGWLTGRVTDRRTGAPLAATVTAVGGPSVVADGGTGEYLIWLEAGDWPLEVSAAGYLPITANVTIAPQTAALPHDFELRYDGPQATVSPTHLTMTVTWGQVVTRNLIIGNSGTQPLAFHIYETTMEDDWPAPPSPVKPYHQSTVGGTWGEQDIPLHSLQRNIVAVPSAATEGALDPFIFDPQGDAGQADLVLGEAAISDPGWDGEPSALTLRLTFAAAVAPHDVVGYIYLDTDRNPDTGRSPRDMGGLAGQDIGYDYYLDLFGLPSLGLVDVWRQDGVYIGSAVGEYTAHSLTIVLPLSLLGREDGVMDVALALGTIQGAEDWAPEIGHAIIGLGADWLTESPVAEDVPAEAEQTILLSLDTSRLQPGLHTARLAVGNNDSITPLLYVPLSITVEPAPTMGRLMGRVTNRYTGQGMGARILAQGGPYTSSDPDTGQYTLWLEEGDWLVRAIALSAPASVSQTVTVNVSAQGMLDQDFILAWCDLYLPLVMRE